MFRGNNDILFENIQCFFCKQIISQAFTKEISTPSFVM